MVVEQPPVSNFRRLHAPAPAPAANAAPLKPYAPPGDCLRICLLGVLRVKQMSTGGLCIYCSQNLLLSLVTLPTKTTPGSPQGTIGDATD